MADYPSDKFTFFSNCNKSKIEGKEDEFWARAEWPIAEVNKFIQWAKDAQRTVNQRGEECIVVAQKLMPRTSAAGNDYLLSIISDPKPKRDTPAATPAQASESFDDIPF